MSKWVLTFGVAIAVATMADTSSATSGDELGWWTVAAENGNGNVDVSGAFLVGNNSFTIWACGFNPSLQQICGHTNPSLFYGSSHGSVFQGDSGLISGAG